MSLPKKIIFYLSATLLTTQASAIFYGGEHWHNTKTKKECFLVYETHDFKNPDSVEPIIAFAKKGNTKVLAESNRLATEKEPLSTYSILPWLHQSCVDNNIPVEDIDIRGKKTSEPIDNEKNLVKQLEVTSDRFAALRQEIKKSDDPQEAQEFYKKEIAELEGNPFFELLQKTLLVLKKEKKHTENLDKLYEKIGTKFIKDYKKLSRTKGKYFEARLVFSENRDKNIPAKLFSHMTRKELRTLVDMQIVRSLFEAFKQYDTVILAAGGKHCYAVTKLFKTMDNQKLITTLGWIDPIGSLTPIDLNKLFPTV